MNPDPTDLEQRLRATLRRTADQVTEAPRPALSWERPGAGEQVTVPAPRRRSRVRTAVRVVAPLAVAAAVAAVVVLPGQQQSGTGQVRSGVATVTAAPPLQQVALLAPASTVPLQPGQFLYSRETWLLGGAGGETTMITEVWRPQHATDPWTRRLTYLDTATGELSRYTTTGEAMLPETLTAPCGDFFDEVVTCDDAGSLDNPTPQFLTTLPEDPAQLYQQLQTWAVDRDRAETEHANGEETIDYTDEDVLAQTTINGIIDFALATNGMSQPFSARLQEALATMPGAVIGHETNADGHGVVSYGGSWVDSSGAVQTTNLLVFDADGNFVGTPYSAVVVGTADTAGVAPPLA